MGKRIYHDRPCTDAERELIHHAAITHLSAKALARKMPDRPLSTVQSWLYRARQQARAAGEIDSIPGAGRPMRVVTADGFTGSIPAHAERLGCQTSTLYRRRAKSGMSMIAIIEDIARNGHHERILQTTVERAIVRTVIARGHGYSQLRRALPYRPPKTLIDWLAREAGNQTISDSQCRGSIPCSI